MDVHALLEHRRKSNSKPHNRLDECKLGLAIEGGGMRGVVSAGMLTALEHLGYTNCFDAVYGSSAGAINSAYFLANQSAYGTSIYYNDANTDKFISWMRVFKNKPPMDLDYLLFNVFKHVKVLDWKSTLSCGVKFNILASSLEDQKCVILDEFKTFDDILLALKASACIPWFAGKPVTINGKRYIDASFYESLPYKSAIRDGCTHVLVLRTRPSGERREKVSPFEKFILSRYFKGKDRVHYEFYINNRSDNYNRCVKFLDNCDKNTKTDNTYIDSIALHDKNDAVHQLEKRKDHLLSGALAGYRRTFEYFGICHIKPVDVITPFYPDGYQFIATEIV